VIATTVITFLPGAIEPEDAVCARCLVFSIGLEDIFAVWAGYGCEFMRVKTGMTWVALQIGQGFPDCFKPLCEGWILFQFIQNGAGLNGELQVK
jgi:hypothetical protein